MHAVRIHQHVMLDGLRVGRTRIVQVVESLPEPGGTERELLTEEEARALVELGYAEPVSAEFEHLARTALDGLDRAG